MRATRISYAELEAAFPWVRFLPDEAARQFMDIIDNYCAAAAIYSRRASLSQPRKCQAPSIIWACNQIQVTPASAGNTPGVWTKGSPPWPVSQYHSRATPPKCPRCWTCLRSSN